jgi:hypothetical protein
VPVVFPAPFKIKMDAGPMNFIAAPKANFELGSLFHWRPEMAKESDSVHK